MKKLILHLLLLVFFCCSSGVQAQVVKVDSLIVASFKSDEKLGETHQIYSYNFVSGKYVSKELITSDKDIRFASLGSKIYQNRYAISANGDIVDILKRKIVHKSEGELFRIDKDRIFIEVNRNNKGGLYVYNLREKNYRLFRSNKGNFGILSPNGIRSVFPNGSALYISGNGKDITLGGFLLNVEDDVRSSERLKVCAFWLDDRRILTQNGNGNLVVVDMKGNETPILEIKDEPKCKGNPRIYKTDTGKLIYRCSKEYEIDISTRTYKIAQFDLGFGFDRKKTNDYWNEYLFESKEIGKLWSSDFRTTNDYLAILYANDNENLGYPKGVKVWNTFTKEWAAIEIEWGAHLIGWVSK